MRASINGNTTDNIILNIRLPAGKEFSHKDMLDSQYISTTTTLGGQHIVECDYNLLTGIYKERNESEIPVTIMYKTCEIFINCTENEETFLVNVDNSRTQLNMTILDQV